MKWPRQQSGDSDLNEPRRCQEGWGEPHRGHTPAIRHLGDEVGELLSPRLVWAAQEGCGFSVQWGGRTTQFYDGLDFRNTRAIV